MSIDETPESVSAVKEEILKAMRRGLNVTANAVHIRDLAEAYALLEGSLGSTNTQVPAKKAATPLLR